MLSKYSPFIDAAKNKHNVNGLTHNFYKYPARFSPLFVDEAISAVSSPGDFNIRSVCWWRNNAH